MGEVASVGFWDHKSKSQFTPVCGMAVSYVYGLTDVFSASDVSHDTIFFTLYITGTSEKWIIRKKLAIFYHYQLFH
jgi:hypothetical protein